MKHQIFYTISELSAMGVQFIIDDFGTGYSSFMYVKQYPISALKIDRSFVRDLCKDHNDAAITQSIVTMSHGLNMRVIAEGVETADQLNFLQKSGCHEMQGYYF